MSTSLFPPLPPDTRILQNMAISVIVSKEQCSDGKLGTQKVHYMPCKIKYDGPANFSKYIQPVVDEDSKDVMKASFQGHPILGQEVKLHDKYVGLLLEKGKNFDGPNKKVFATHTFDSFIQWNWDKTPSKNDMIIKVMDWIEIAEVLHASEPEVSS